MGKAAPRPLAVPDGKLVPRPLAVPDGKSAPRPLAVPDALGVVVAGPLAVEPLLAEPLLAEPPAVEPREEPAPDFMLDVGLGDAGAFATVTAGALAVAVSGEQLQLATETVAENSIVSPAGAVLGTLTCASICGAAGCFAGRVRSRLVLPGLPGPLATVNTGWLNAGVFAPGVSVVVILPSSREVDHAEIRYRMVPPGGTLFVDAETVTSGLVGARVPVGAPTPVSVGLGAGLVVEGAPCPGLGRLGPDLSPRCDGEAEAPGEEAAGLAVALAAGADDLADFGLDDAAGADDVAGLDDTTGLDGTTGLDDTAGVDDAAGRLDAGELDAPVGDGVGDADDVTAMTMPVTPLKLTKRPVARTSVTGRACGARMDHTLSIDAVLAEIVL